MLTYGNQNFTMFWQDVGPRLHATSGYVTVDGHQIGGLTILAAHGEHSGSKNYTQYTEVPTSATTVRPLRFARLELTGAFIPQPGSDFMRMQGFLLQKMKTQGRLQVNYSI
jgi:hypothetical protein